MHSERLCHTVFTDICAVFLADFIWLHRGTTFIWCIRIPTRPYTPFTRIHTRTPTKYCEYSPETIEVCFGYFHDILYN